MDFGMRDLNQEIIKFDYKKNFKDDDFYVSESNKHIFSTRRMVSAKNFN